MCENYSIYLSNPNLFKKSNLTDSEKLRNLRIGLKQRRKAMINELQNIDQILAFIEPKNDN